ncbi:MAG: hypothetical protein ACLURV_02090 [Gallintestinimicrobium sp.]
MAEASMKWQMQGSYFIAELEKILADAGEMAQAPGTVYSSLVNAD